MVVNKKLFKVYFFVSKKLFFWNCFQLKKELFFCKKKCFLVVLVTVDNSNVPPPPLPENAICYMVQKTSDPCGTLQRSGILLPRMRINDLSMYHKDQEVCLILVNLKFQGGGWGLGMVVNKKLFKVYFFVSKKLFFWNCFQLKKELFFCKKKCFLVVLVTVDNSNVPPPPLPKNAICYMVQKTSDPCGTLQRSGILVPRMRIADFSMHRKDQKVVVTVDNINVPPQPHSNDAICYIVK